MEQAFQTARIPVSTYRLQFNGGIGFSGAAGIIGYLSDLGISDIYSSPYLKAKRGSLHGYDIVDHNALNPEIGTEEEYGVLAGELRKYGMGQLLDFVPNHMCIESSDNGWWMDVLENGQSSRFARFFDIDWEPVKRELKDKVLLPVLGDQYGNVLEGQELRLSFEDGAFFINYHELKLPVRPRSCVSVLDHGIEELKVLLPGDDALLELLSINTALRNFPPHTEREPDKMEERAREKEVIRKRLRKIYGESRQIREFIDGNVAAFNGLKGEPGSFDLLDGLLREQIYRLSFWRVATEEINYRRFFDVNSLASIRTEDPIVFEETHRLIFRFVREGRVTGLRVDHPDGLFNPAEYFSGLQRECFIQMRLGTGPVMAKGVEDTAFYVYNRLVSLNEVGGSPDRFGNSLEAFHGKNIERMKSWPHALIATSTHDSKRSEDVRARINVLSEMPGEWKDRLMKWSRFNKRRKPVVDGVRVPDRNEEYLLYQTLVGAWPAGPASEAEYGSFKERIMAYMLKAVREAKVNTSWINPNTIYEDALMLFIGAIMEERPDNLFLKDFIPFQKRISDFGMFNSLSQTLLKITSPGVPDFYQGTELWSYSLVDPDNRGPVDYDARIRLLGEIKKGESEVPLSDFAVYLTKNKDNGAIKLYLTYRALNFRRNNRDLFERGEYLPLEVIGERANNVCAFARRLGRKAAIVAAPRFFTKLIPQSGDLPLGPEVWGDSSIIIPASGAGERFLNVFTGEVSEVVDDGGKTALYLSGVLKNFPVALLERVS